jgi:nitrate/nitrite transporter NarK
VAVAYGWRMSFFVNAVIGVVWVLACYLWFKDFPSQMKNISENEKQKIESGCRHSKQQHSIPLKFIFKNRTVWTLMLMYFCFQWANYFLLPGCRFICRRKDIFQKLNETDHFFIIPCCDHWFIGWRVYADWLVRKKGLRFGRRLIGMTGMGMCGLLILAAAVAPQNKLAALSLVAANGFYGLSVMSCFGVCSDIGRNNSGTVTGAMNFSGQMGSFFSCNCFWKNCRHHT